MKRKFQKEDLREIEFDFSYQKLMGKQKKISSWFQTICFLFFRVYFVAFLSLRNLFPSHLFLTKKRRSNLSWWWCFLFNFFLWKQKNLTQFSPVRKIFLYLLIDRLLKLIESRTCNLFSSFFHDSSSWHDLEKFFITLQWYLFPYPEIASWILILCVFCFFFHSLTLSFSLFSVNTSIRFPFKQTKKKKSFPGH